MFSSECRQLLYVVCSGRRVVGGYAAVKLRQYAGYIEAQDKGRGFF